MEPGAKWVTSFSGLKPLLGSPVITPLVQETLQDLAAGYDPTLSSHQPLHLSLCLNQPGLLAPFLLFPTSKCVHTLLRPPGMCSPLAKTNYFFRFHLNRILLWLLS